MADQDHQNYYFARAATSRDLAGRAANPAVAAIHAELAIRYELLAKNPSVLARDFCLFDQPT